MTVLLKTTQGTFALRPEQPQDACFLYTLFRSHMAPSIAAMPVDDAVKESLLRMQFRSQTMTYAAQYAGARFDILERDGRPFGRLIVHEDAGVATFVDFALLPDMRGAGIGTAVIKRVLDWVAERCPIVHASVMAGNEASLRMIRRVGFIPVGEIPPFLQLEWQRPQPFAATVVATGAAAKQSP